MKKLKQVILGLTMISAILCIYLIPYNFTRSPFEWYHFGNVFLLAFMFTFSLIRISSVASLEEEDEKNKRKIN